MQETVARSLESMSSLAAPGNTPSLDEVRDKIERRYANAMGRAELAGNSVEGRMLEIQKSTPRHGRLVPARADPVQHGRRAARRRTAAAGRAAGRAGRLRPPTRPAAGPAGRDPGQHGQASGAPATRPPPAERPDRGGQGGRRADTVLPAAAPAAPVRPAVERAGRWARRRGGGAHPVRRPRSARRGLGRRGRRRRWRWPPGAGSTCAPWPPSRRRPPLDPAEAAARSRARLVAAVERLPVGPGVLAEVRRRPRPDRAARLRRGASRGPGWTGRRSPWPGWPAG